MNKTALSIIIAVCMTLCASCGGSVVIARLVGATYYIDPQGGSDSNSGTSSTQPWKTFSRINQISLDPGDRIKINPGSFKHSLKLSGTGTPDLPVQVTFAPGRYDFFPEDAIRNKYNISNTNGDPDTPKAVGILFENAKHFKLTGPGADIVYRGKMIEVCIDKSEDISISGLSFDYHRPTVSEFTVSAVGNGYLDLKIHPDSWYSIEDGKIIWKGEGWSHGDEDGLLAQELDPKTNRVWRKRNPLPKYTFEEIKPGLVRARGTGSIRPGLIYQSRKTFRDCCGAFTRRSKDITWKDVHFKFMHGMGLVNQFSENLTFENVTVAPDKSSGRTTAAWADCIQVSGCRGKVLVRDCTFSGAHDDAINIHGTHLRVIEELSDKRIKVKFMHKQTYGFYAFNPGDEIKFVRWDSLATYAPNKVKDAELLNPEEILLTLENPVPTDIRENDAVENVTWTPAVHITGCGVSRIPTRGFLITTRRKVLVENNTFNKTSMSAILLEDDARGWYESGCIRDMTIRENTFIQCAEPVINFNPRNTVPNDAVHRNVLIEKNTFKLRRQTAVKAKSTKNITIKENKIHAPKKLTDKTAIKTTNCADVKISDNRYLLEK